MASAIIARLSGRIGRVREVGRLIACVMSVGLLPNLVSVAYADSTLAVVTESGSTDSTRDTSPTDAAVGPLDELASDWSSFTNPERLSGTVRAIAVMSVLSLAPAILLMTTCYVRIMIVLSLLRQALGTQQMPPNQVLTTVALFLTFLIMTPVWKRVHEEAIVPYTDPNVPMTLNEAWQAGVQPVRQFMSHQIERAGNGDEVWLFLDYLPADTPTPQTYDDVPLQALLPAFLLSELKTAFLIGFRIFLPFVVLDLVVASVTISMGMFMLPPTTISLPLKLLLFVLVDGWHLLVGMLLESFEAV